MFRGFARIVHNLAPLGALKMEDRTGSGKPSSPPESGPQTLAADAGRTVEDGARSIPGHCANAAWPPSGPIELRPGSGADIEPERSSMYAERLIQELTLLIETRRARLKHAQADLPILDGVMGPHDLLH
ncbi:MAG: hypothetical protein ABW032_10660 [Burkholderiaceae bacterium]